MNNKLDEHIHICTLTKALLSMVKGDIILSCNPTREKSFLDVI